MAHELGWDAFDGLAREFLTELPGALGKLPEHLAAGARQELHRGAHSLKGNCLTLGLDQLAGALLRIEEEAATSEPDRLALLIGELSTPAADGERALREWLRAGRSACGHTVLADRAEEKTASSPFQWTGRRPVP